MTLPVCRFIRHTLLALLAIMGSLKVEAAVPHLLNHQGLIAVDGESFEGNGLFKFALVNADATISYWSNDGTSTAGSEPANAVTLPVTQGLYAVLLGDASLTHMAAIPASVFSNDDVRLRVWFSDGLNHSQLLAPDQRLAAIAYALAAATVELSQVLAPPSKPVLAWGKNTDGQTSVPELADVAAIAAGDSCSMALLKNGTVVQWGAGAAVPPDLTGVTAIAAGANHRLARLGNGTVVAWGENSHGQAPASVGLSNVTAVAAGEKHSLALLADGTVAAWGNNDFGQTEFPRFKNKNVIAIACGYDHNLALKADGTVVAWGRADAGQIDVPAGLKGVIAIAAGAFHSLAVKSDGSVVAWGWDGGGQSTVPEDLNGVAKVAGAYAFSMALKHDGTLVAWGDSDDNKTTLPAAATEVAAIAAGASHGLALRAALIPAQVARIDQDNLFTGNIGINRRAAENALEVEGQASKSTAGSWLSNSDRRIKDAIHPVTGALEKLDQVRLVDFRYTDVYRAAHPGIADKRYLNVIAQEFAEVFPDHVQSSGEKLPDGSDILQVDTYPLTIYSAAAVQELHRENQAFKKRFADQEERLRRLETLLSK
jgi:hypothetical protein